jgi:hypothetical protein
MRNGLLKSICAGAKMNKWKKADDDDALKCWNCERILDAEQLGLPKPAELTMADITLD